MKNYSQFSMGVLNLIFTGYVSKPISQDVSRLSLVKLY